ncbi:MAG: SpoIIE family protein phosphatase, partial [Acutalibacteraceae bacterium]
NFSLQEVSKVAYFNETAMDIMIIAGIQSATVKKTKLEERCIRPNALMREIDKYYSDFVNSMASKMRVSEMRSIVSDQFAGISQFLSEIAAQMRSSRVVSSSKSRAIKTALSDGGFYIQSLYYYTNAEGRVTVEALLEEDAPEPDFKKMKNIIEFTTGRRFERPEIAITDLRTMIIFEERATFKVLVGHSQIPFAKNKVSGDCIGRAYDGNGGEIALISDGMGTGSRAAIDATMTTALLEKLLSCGFSFDSALKMVNCALMVKSTDESLATVDGVCINVYTGQTSFYKAGAAISFIRREQSVTLIEEASMPIGIIRNITPACRSVKLNAGDIVLLVSDGVTVGDSGWISDELLAWSTNSMDDLASHIASLAKLRSDEKNADDISVVAVKIAKN